MVYLNDVEEGGETAFPVAEDRNFNQKVTELNLSLIINSCCKKGNIFYDYF